ncbi:MAG: protease complex subunit PrcB family protein [Brevibacillus sp.]|nr:protease complex subunit PrcB family protein [Brevibacillus sp.]
MKRRKTVPALLLTLSLLISGTIAAEEGVQVKLDGELFPLSRELVMQSGRTMIEVEDAAKLIDGQVEEAEGLITLTAPDGSQLVYKPDTNQVKAGQEWVTIDQGAIKNGYDQYLPLRWTLEQLGYHIRWDEQTRTISISETKGSGQFVLVDEADLTEKEKMFVEKVVKEPGVYRLGDLYVIARGQTPHPGYGLELVKQQMSGEQLLVYVRLTEPEEGKLYAQVISYPYLVGRAKLPPHVTMVVLDAATGKRLFSE